MAPDRSAKGTLLEQMITIYHYDYSAEEQMITVYRRTNDYGAERVRIVISLYQYMMVVGL